MHRNFLFLLLAIGFFQISGQSCSDTRQSDSLFLVKFYNSLEHKGLMYEWDFSKPLDRIDPLRVRLSADGCFIEYINFENSGLKTQGYLFPMLLLGMTHLKYLNLSFCNLKGNIPNELYNLNDLTQLDFSYNFFSGKLNPSISKLTKLESLVLSENQLSGELIPELFQLTKLKDLNIRKNKFSGRIPSQIASLKNLEKLRLGQNSLTGTLPVEIGQLTQLTEISLQSNQLDGPVPSSLDQLTNLQIIYLNDNYFTGIPKLQNTWYRLLDVSSNKFTFEDLLPLYQSKLNSSAEFYYSPQRDFNVGNRYYLNPGSRHTMTVSIDGSVANNKVSWLRNNSNVGNGKDCSIQSFNNSIHGGVYSSIVENAELPSLKLNVNHDTLACLPQTGIYNLTLCENKFVDIHGRRFDVNHTSDSILLMGFSQNACDSLVLVHVEIIENSTDHFYSKICKGMPFEWNGQLYFERGVYPQRLVNQGGCDSVVYLHLEISELKDNAIIQNDLGNNSGTIEVFITDGLPPYQYHWSTGSNQSKITNLGPGIYQLEVLDANQCSKKFFYEIRNQTGSVVPAENLIKVYPNPVPGDVDMVHFIASELTGDEKPSFFWVNSLGQLQSAKSIHESGNEWLIQRPDQAGVFLLRIAISGRSPMVYFPVEIFR
ncbi:MAG: hypothetical protein IPJ83_04675 [Saprospiraceae bacterium]|nr:hypothetical protein [Candidatus Vicinibacter proximus]